MDKKPHYKRKTNIGALIYFAGWVYGFHIGQVDFAMLMSQLGATLAVVGFRDKMEKS